MLIMSSKFYIFSLLNFLILIPRQTNSIPLYNYSFEDIMELYFTEQYLPLNQILMADSYNLDEQIDNFKTNGNIHKGLLKFSKKRKYRMIENWPSSDIEIVSTWEFKTIEYPSYKEYTIYFDLDDPNAEITFNRLSNKYNSILQPKSDLDIFERNSESKKYAKFLSNDSALCYNSNKSTIKIYNTFYLNLSYSDQTVKRVCEFNPYGCIWRNLSGAVIYKKPLTKK